MDVRDKMTIFSLALALSQVVQLLMRAKETREGVGRRRVKYQKNRAEHAFEDQV